MRGEKKMKDIRPIVAVVATVFLLTAPGVPAWASDRGANVYLVNKKTGDCITLSGDGGPATLFPAACGEEHNRRQGWNLVEQGTGSGVKKIKVQSTYRQHLCIGYQGQRVQLTSCLGGEDVLWWPSWCYDSKAKLYCVVPATSLPVEGKEHGNLVERDGRYQAVTDPADGTGERVFHYLKR
ncbi:hypothetical protein AB0A74_06800 [Saccharothrix sp. NPDC042600]|uniref:RICIN domain-containing protein n=1 Tax=Saccharothrix TaxID=2071 RepID=UPI0033C2F0A6|nr:hypothetical protein GCM10017745_31210 [Saccharothrix mutabilis subsp. capreolus]